MRTFFCIAILSIFLVGCRAHTGGTTAGGIQNCNYNTGLATAGGIIIGGLLGQAIGGDSKSTAIGAGLGGVVGAVGSSYLQQRCLQMNAAIARMQIVKATASEVAFETQTRNNNGTVKRQKEEGISVSFDSQGMFATGSHKLNPQARRDIEEMAQAYVGTDRKILIVGHTDKRGSDEYNQALSERRAREVADVLVSRGVSPNSLYTKGAGETQPKSDNDPDNRRVEIVELQSEEAIVAYDDNVDKETEARYERGRQAEAEAEAAANQAGGGKGKWGKFSLPKWSFNLPKWKWGSNSDSDSSNNNEDSQTSQWKGAEFQTTRNAGPIDLGGRRVQDTPNFDYFTSTGRSAKRSFRNKANANQLSLPCIATQPPRGEIAIQRYGDNEAIRLKHNAATDYLPHLNGSDWDKEINNYRIVLQDVAVLRKGKLDQRNGVIHIHTDGDNDPEYILQGMPDIFEGENGLLYRVFFPEEALPLKCIDVVFDKNKGYTPVDGNIFYEKNSETFFTDFIPEKI